MEILTAQTLHNEARSVNELAATREKEVHQLRVWAAQLEAAARDLDSLELLASRFGLHFGPEPETRHKLFEKILAEIDAHRACRENHNPNPGA